MPSQLALAMNFPVYDVCKTGCSPPYSYSVAGLDAILHLQGSLYRSGHEFSYVVYSWIVRQDVHPYSLVVLCRHVYTDQNDLMTVK